MLRLSRAARLISAVLAALALLAPAAPFATADPGQSVVTISAQASMGADFAVQVAGAVTVQGGSVNNIQVRGSVAGRDIGTATTAAGGAFAFSFAMPDDLRGAPQSLTLSTEAHGKLAAASITIPVAAAVPPSTAPPAKLQLSLKASADKTDVSPGSLITVSGSLATTAGAPVRSAQIDLLLDGDLLDESTVLTDNNGRFSTFFELPIGEPAGQPKLSVNFSGSDGFEAATKQIVLTVTIDSPEPSPTPTENTAASSAAPASSEAATQPPAPSLGPSPTSSAADSTAAAPPISSPWAWFLAGLVGVGGTALLVTGILVFRGWRTGRAGESDSLDLMSDPDDDDFDDGYQVDEVPPPEDPPAKPRRGI